MCQDNALESMGESEPASGSIPDDVILQFIESFDHPVITAMEIAEEFDISQQAAHWRLSKLEEKGSISRKKVGARAVVWWIAGDYSISLAT